MEKTLSIIKPDAVERNLIGQIVSIFEKNSLTIHSIKKIKLSKKMAENFYFVHKDRPFFNDLCDYMSSGPVVVMILEGNNAVLKNREIMGVTNPKDAAKGTIRNLYGISLDKNSVHGSDSNENAKIEIDFFFKE
ncbi:MAG: nucleoside-diphosphate kinase [Proteobacteria bacterium]|uniref:Nucleoside diphosphate kinase n=1 Tax=Candidatus Fonsibacter lacus TaxID=2576439 RepID=A0A964UZF2_9PROT|nr:nucleoside-diphosphate kinase [Candidatus Fonsibacter lacus]